jgi:uncharacterized membrane protein
MSAQPGAVQGRAPEVSAPRDALDRWIVAVADPVLSGAMRHWLFGVNTLVLLVLAGGLAAPFLSAAGLEGPGNTIYELYRTLCHQWAFRSLFLLGPQAIYSREQLQALGVDPFRSVGDPTLGWKLAFCERDLGIFLGLLLFGLLYAARWRQAALRPSSYLLYGVLILPMGLDGLTQLVGWRESTWELRLATGLLFGVASAWLLYPRFERSFQRSLAT